MRHALILTAAALVLAACSPEAETPDKAQAALPPGPETAITEVAVADLPVALTGLVEATVPGMTIAEVERKARDGRVYFDVEGRRPDGSEVELDIQQVEGGRFEVVEIQRDIAIGDMPANARELAESAPGAVPPVRIIESRQTDGSVIYELFADGRPAEPAMEVRVKDGQAERLTERWPH